MDVARPRLDCTGDKQIDEPDYGRLRREILEMAYVLFFLITYKLVALPLVDPLYDLVHVLLIFAVEPGDVLVDDSGVPGMDEDVTRGRHPQCIDNLPFGRIGHDDLECPILPFKGDEPVLPDEARRYAVHDKGYPGKLLWSEINYRLAVHNPASPWNTTFGGGSFAAGLSGDLTRYRRRPAWPQLASPHVSLYCFLPLLVAEVPLQAVSFRPFLCLTAGRLEVFRHWLPVGRRG